jgi:hemolysin III
MESEYMNEPYRLSFGEEVGNSISHGVMFVLLLFSLPYYAVRTYIHGGSLASFGVSVYLICMIFMFATSCFYHFMPYGTPWKHVFRRLDHMTILLAIAGTYTPICICVLNNWIGWTVLAIEWTAVVGGILLKAIAKKRMKGLSLTIYIVMGWLALVILPYLLAKTNWVFLSLIAAGGLLYTIGIWFYSHPQKRFFHFTWHIFIVLASICHMIAILYCMPL